MKNILGKVKEFGVKGLVGFVVVVILLSSYGYNEGGVNTRLQMPVFGHSWIKEEGYYLKMPFVSRTRSLNKNGTIAATDNKDLIEASSIVVPPMTAPFADSFQMRFEWSARYELPLDDEGLENVYQKLKSQEALLGNTVMPFAQTLFTNSVNQMIGENFAQGGKSTLLQLVDNQAQFGQYQTKVEKVSKTRNAGQGSNDTLGGTQTDLEVTKVTYLKDSMGKRLRTPLSISQYGIKIVPNSFQIVENMPVGRLVTFIDKKQASLESQIEQDEIQKLLAKKAKSEQLKGEMDLVTRTNALNIEKQEAIIAGEKRNEIASLQAEKETIEANKVANLAIINKNRELQIAKSNEAIQRANAVAAAQEAKAIKQIGFAEAAVAKAKLAAKQANKTIYLAELAKETTIAQAKYMTQTKLDAPDTVIINGNGVGSNTTSDLLNIKLLQDVTKK